MTDKQVVWFMGFFSASIFPRRIFFSTVIMNQLDLTPLISCVICILVTFVSLAQAALRRHADMSSEGQQGRDANTLMFVKSLCYFNWTFLDQMSVLKLKDETGEVRVR